MTRLAPDGSTGLPTPEDCRALSERVFRHLTFPAAQLGVRARRTSTTALALGDAREATHTTSLQLELLVSGRNTYAVMSTNRTDDEALRRLVAQTEAAALQRRPLVGTLPVPGPREPPPAPERYFDSIPAAMAAEPRAEVLSAALDATEAAGLSAAGDLHLELECAAQVTTAGRFLYERSSYGEFSLTARSPDGTGSGWGWSGAEDWSRVRVPEVIAWAVDLGVRSQRPVAIEPGRYTVILEPAAVATLLGSDWRAREADLGRTPFSKMPLGTNKIGLRMLDERLGMVSDPWDRDLPTRTFNWWTGEVAKVVLFERGVLRNLEYDPQYAAEKGRPAVMIGNGLRLYAEGPTQSLEEMIAGTERGVWVNRLSNVVTMNDRTQLLTGTTRDGAFLIEKGKITRPIRNFRFTESPFFVLNKLEAAGAPVRASRHVVCPRLKVRDFDFTSLTDAI